MHGVTMKTGTSSAMGRDRQTDRLPHLIRKRQTTWGTKLRTVAQKTSGLLIGPEQVTWPKSLPAI